MMDIEFLPKDEIIKTKESPKREKERKIRVVSDLDESEFQQTAKERGFIFSTHSIDRIKEQFGPFPWQIFLHTLNMAIEKYREKEKRASKRRKRGNSNPCRMKMTFSKSSGKIIMKKTAVTHVNNIRFVWKKEDDKIILVTAFYES